MLQLHGKECPEEACKLGEYEIETFGYGTSTPCKSEDVKNRKLLRKLLASPHNVRFGDLCKLAQGFGYRLDRVSGSHHIFEHSEASRPLNLQNVGGKAKPYQVRQFLRDIEEFQLTLKE